MGMTQTTNTNGDAGIRVQIRYYTGAGDSHTSWGWATIDGQRPPADGTERNNWARNTVAGKTGHPTDAVRVMAVYVGTQGSLARINRP